MPSEREIAFAKYWEGKEGRRITLETVRNAYLAGWSDKPELPTPSPQSREQTRSALVDVPAVESEPAGEQWCAYEDGHQHTSWYPDGYGDRAGWAALAKRNPGKYQVVTRPVYASPVRSAIAPAPAEETWQPIETAPKDRTKVLLWNEQWLHPVVGYWSRTINAFLEYGSRDAKANVATHWRPLPAPPSLVHAEDGMAHGSTSTSAGVAP